MKKLNIRRFDVSQGFDMYTHYEEQYQNGSCTSVLITAIANLDIIRVEKNGVDVSSEWGGLPTTMATKQYTSNMTETLTFYGSDGGQQTTTIDIISIETQFNNNTAVDAHISINPNIKVNNLSLGEMDTKIAALFDLIYPIGSIYYTTDANFSPNVSFSGNWQQIKDTFLLAAGDTYVGGTSGGEAAHKLVESELPSISATWRLHGQESGTIVYTIDGKATGTYCGGKYQTIGTSTSGAYSYQNPGIAFGSNGSHNNMPPYIVVYVWKRVS